MSDTVPTMTAQQAWDICQENSKALLVDVRSSMEYLFVGHPKGAVHVPWIDEPDWDINKNFVTDIRKLVLGGIKNTRADGAGKKDDKAGVPIILICRSGNRSEDAGKLLLEAGMANISHIDEGFEGELDDNHHRSTKGGWRYHNLPWEQC